MAELTDIRETLRERYASAAKPALTRDMDEATRADMAAWTGRVAGCCGAQTQATCCEPADKAACCGEGHATGACGCGAVR
jgi:hypothetical protein